MKKKKFLPQKKRKYSKKQNSTEMKNLAISSKNYNSLKEISRIQTLNNVNIHRGQVIIKKIYTYIKKKVGCCDL